MSLSPGKDMNFSVANSKGGIRILSRMNEFRQSGVLCDTTLLCDDNREFLVHRLVMSAASSYFATMFQTDMIERGSSYVRLKDIDSNAMEILVEYAYTTNISVSVDGIFPLLAASNMLCFGEVEKICIDFLCTNLNMANCIDVCSISEALNCEQLRELATRFVAENFRQLSRTAEFFHLTPSQLETVLSNDKISVSSEVEVYEAVRSWVHYDAEGRKSSLPDLLRHVRFGLMNRKYLLDKVMQDNLTMREEACRKIVLLALERQVLPGKTTLSADCKMSVPRIVLNRTLFAVGGEVQGKTRSSCECYDFVAKQWSPVSALLTPRSRVAVAVLDGRVYAVGGISDGIDLCTVERYDMNTECWAPVAPLTKCRGALSVSVCNGWIYAVGGSRGHDALKFAEQYDPHRNAWNEIPSMRLPRSYFAAAHMNGKIYVVGGYCGISDVEHCEYYEPTGKRWHEITGMNKSRMYHSVAASQDRLYALGGKNSMGLLNSIEKYSPDLNMWLIIKTKFYLRLGMNACLGFKLTHSESGELVIVGGMDQSEEERADVMHFDLQSPDYYVSTGVKMLERRAYMGLAIL